MILSLTVPYETNKKQSYYDSFCWRFERISEKYALITGMTRVKNKVLKEFELLERVSGKKSYFLFKLSTSPNIIGKRALGCETIRSNGKPSNVLWSDESKLNLLEQWWQEVCKYKRRISSRMHSIYNEAQRWECDGVGLLV